MERSDIRERRYGLFGRPRISLPLNAGYRLMSSLLRQVEIAQIRRRLILLDRHQEAVGAEEIVLLADDDMNIVFHADVLAPPDRSLGGDAAVVLGDGPRTRQRIVDHGDFVMQNV